MKKRMARLRSRWDQLSNREQWLVGSLSLLSFLLLFIFGFWQPMNESAQSSKQMLTRERGVLETVIAQSNSIESLRKLKGVDAVSREPLNQVIANSSKALGISLIRIQPRNEQLQVWIEPLPFDKLLDWIKTLERDNGVQVVALDIERADKLGLVEIRRLQFR